MTSRAGLFSLAMLLGAAPVQAQTVAELQRQIDELKAQVKALTQARAAAEPPPAAVAVPAPREPAPQLAVQQAAPPAAVAAKDKWYDRLQLRGYTQIRYKEVLGGEADRPGVSRLRSVHDASIDENGGFLLRRVRLVLQGDVTDRLSVYLQHDFGTAVNNQSSAEPRENFGQLRDAYVDIFPGRDRSFRLRVGQSKVPFGWENLQSSGDRVPLDRSDAINSGVPGERDLGITAYYTPPRVQAIWDELERNDQKLFGNYGAIGVGVYNGQGTNRAETNAGRMAVVLATWPFRLDGLGGGFRGQVLEIGGSAMLNKYRPEVRGGGVSGIDYTDNRVAVHAILYPQPFGIQAEWTWGRGPEFDAVRQAIRAQALSGGYVQLMFDPGPTRLGRIIPYARWQRYRGGWKPNLNAPRLETDEIELGVEWRVLDALELTIAYANMKRREPDERRDGRATGNLIRTQLQWSY